MAWMSGPTTLFRHKLLLNLLDQVKPEQILEIGFGNGDLLLKMNRKGFKGTGIDFSAAAVEEFLQKHKNTALTFSIKHGLAESLLSTPERFNALIACEVLEHIKDDVKTLKNWNSLLAEQGHIILSVPARMKNWGHNDEYAGHVRRYEKEELTTKLNKAGFEIVNFCSYGYPFSNMAKLAGDLLIKKNVKNDASLEERTKDSGIHNVNFKFGKALINDFTLLPFYHIQKMFLHKDLGIGYLVLARKKTKNQE